ncbi:hypothetical protein, partial [Acinetobacter seifertii]|uniref:hypothetical protein n=1 Tax=Acinetobacter seifertii TaxID=1530123 RepID=UPI00124F7AC5
MVIPISIININFIKSRLNRDSGGVSKSMLKQSRLNFDKIEMRITLEIKCPTCLSDSIKKNGIK